MKTIDIVGARPQFIKVAPVLQSIVDYNLKHPDSPIQEILIHTGQHYDYEMSQVFFDDLGLKSPDYHLGVGSGSHAYQTGEMLKRIEEILVHEDPDCVVVYGDTNSTLAGALAATKLHIPIVHVEAGLRSFNRRMPEEINRVLTDHVSDLLLCPTPTAVENLAREGIGQGVHWVGDVMYDAVLLYRDLARERSAILKELNLQPREYVLATVHRAENTDDPERLAEILQALEYIARAHIPVVLPLHPRTRKRLQDNGLVPEHLRVLDPVSYLDMLVLEEHAHAILTDSGGVQKEAFFFKVPCITLREETEWVETVESGWNVLVGHRAEEILRSFHRTLEVDARRKEVNPYGEGRSAYQVISLITRFCHA